MTSAVRYKTVLNATGAALTVSGVTNSNSDGIDKQQRVVKRVYAAADIGTGAGQTRNAGGCIIDVLPTGTNVLMFEAITYYVGSDADETYIEILDNRTIGSVDEPLQPSTVVGRSYLAYALDTSGVMRVYDGGEGAGCIIALNTFTVIKYTIGQS
jgi:hypothetical protein